MRARPNIELLNDFTVCGSARCAERGQLEEWVHTYLRAGPWANLPLSEVLQLRERFCVGPIEVRTDNIDRQCGPEEDMIYRVSVQQWEQKIESIRLSIQNVLDLPPLIVNSVNATLRNPDGRLRFVIADGAHRLEALRRMGREWVFVLIWFETEEQREEYFREQTDRQSHT